MDAAIQTEVGPAHANMRAYLAGTGATGALIGGALIVFLALAAFVAFNGLPLAGQGTGEGSISLSERSIASGAPESAALAAANAPRTVAATPAAPVPTTTVQAVDPSLVADNTVPGNFGEEPPGTDTGTDGGGPLGSVLGGVDDTTGSVGLDLPLGPATDQLTGPIDNTTRNTLNNVGGLLDRPLLGDNTIKAVNQVTGALLGEDGLVQNLLQRIRGG